METGSTATRGRGAQFIDGRWLDLDTVVPLVCQFATAESLRAKSVFFTDSDTVEDIREWVSAGGDFRGDWGPRFQNQPLSKVHGRPMHSHVVERAVNVASALVQKCGSHEREDRMSVKISAIINELLVLKRAAVIEAEPEREAAGCKALKDAWAVRGISARGVVLHVEYLRSSLRRLAWR